MASSALAFFHPHPKCPVHHVNHSIASIAASLIFRLSASDAWQKLSSLDGYNWKHGVGRHRKIIGLCIICQWHYQFLVTAFTEASIQPLCYYFSVEGSLLFSKVVTFLTALTPESQTCSIHNHEIINSAVYVTQFVVLG